MQKNVKKHLLNFPFEMKAKSRTIQSTQLGLRKHAFNQRDGTVREVGGGFRMGNTCTSVADSC